MAQKTVLDTLREEGEGIELEDITLFLLMNKLNIRNKKVV